VNLLQHQGKKLFLRHGIAVSRCRVARSPAEASADAGRAAVQLLGSAGTHEVEQVLVEEKLSIAQELYLCIKVDDVLGAPIVIASCSGGIDVESNADRIHTLPVDMRQGVRRHHAVALWKRAGASGVQLEQLTNLTVSLWNAFCATDAEQMEINPLVFNRKAENVGAAAVELSAADLADIENALAGITVEGHRYTAARESQVNR